MTQEMIPVAELDAVGLIGPYYCTCLDNGNYYVGESGYCWFCEAVERVLQKRKNVVAAEPSED